MRVVVDLQSCQSGSRLGGIGRYSLDLLKAMVTKDQKNEYVLVLNNSANAFTQNLATSLADFVPVDCIRFFDVPSKVSYYANNGAITAAAELLREKFIQDLNPDVVHLTSLFEGLGDEIVTSIGRLPGTAPVVTTLYDLIPAQYPELYLQDFIAKQHYFDKLNYLTRSSALLSISEFSAHEFRSFFPEYSNPIVNIAGGIDAKFCPAEETSREFEIFKISHSIDQYVLYTASFDQRKNQKGLIEAFSRLPEAILSKSKLVLIGNGNEGIYGSLRSFGVKLGLNASHLVFPGHVSDKLLIELYSNCSLFVFPSLAEGLGMPVLEAMACGAPVISSNRTCLPEVVGNKKALFDPEDYQSLSNLMANVLTQREFSDELKQCGLKRCTEFSWEASATRAIATLTNVVHQHSLSRPPTEIPAIQPDTILMQSSIYNLSTDEISSIAACATSNEVEAELDWAVETPLKIGWVSTWNTRCGIANYSQYLTDSTKTDIIPLAPYATTGRVGADEAKVKRCWDLGLVDDLNGIFQEAINSELEAVVIQINYGFFGFSNLAVTMQKLIRHGVAVFVTLHSTIDPPQDIVPNKLKTLAPTLNLVDRVFVHTGTDVQRLRDVGVADNVTILPLGVKRHTEANQHAPTRSRKRCVASYGFFLPNKGIPELIEAANIAKRAGSGFELLLVNSDYGDSGGVSRAEIAHAKKLVNEFDLGDEVTFVTDYLEDDQSHKLLQMADLIVFAYQKSGESSSAAVRTGIATLKPVAVTPLSIFDDVRTVTHLLPGTSPDLLAGGICELLRKIEGDDESISSVESNAVRWVNTHDYDAVMRALRRQIRRALSSSWIDLVRPDIQSLPTGVGRLQQGRIKTTGVSGVLVYGPYANLEAGRYRLLLMGYALSDLEATATVRLTASFGAELIMAEGLVSESGQFQRELHFILNADRSGFEVVVTVEDEAEFELSGYVLSKRQ